jgi:hypothetical protein
MIREELIEKIVDQLETAEFENELEKLKMQYPLLHAYLLNDQLETLTDDEFMILFFDALVIVKSFEQSGTMPSALSEERLEELESDNWNRLHDSKPVNFHEKLDVFFEATRQEDLLAFIEDSLADDDEQLVSSAAREILFICLKSIVDLLDQAE